MRELVELKRLLHNVVRIGVIAEVDYASARARLADDDGFTSDWRPWAEQRAGTTRTWNPPTVGEQAVLISPGGDPATGIILLGLYADAQPAPADDPDLTRTVYPDGAIIEYDHGAHHLQATLPGSATVDAQTDVAVHAGGAIEATAVADITASTQANISASAEGQATLTAAGGAVINANTVINGNLSLNGTFAQVGSKTATFNNPVNFTKSVKHNGIAIDSSHRHGGVQSGGSNTGTVT